MTDYTKIQSKYIKDKIKNLTMTKKNADYIDDLMRIESWATNGRKQLARFKGQWKPYIQMKYTKEWDAIGLELNPKHVVALKQEREKSMKKCERILNAHKNRELKEKIDAKRTWKLAGGKIK